MIHIGLFILISVQLIIAVHQPGSQLNSHAGNYMVGDKLFVMRNNIQYGMVDMRH